MNDSTRVMRRPRRARPPAARTAAAIIATAALALLAAACSSSPSSTGSAGSSSAGRSANSQIGINYANCMRSHGVPKYPDPSSNELANGLPKVSLQQLEVSSSQYQAAQNACAHLLPNNGQETQPQSQRELNAMRSFARCMRSHGVPTWPDPHYFGEDGGWGFYLVGVHGFDPNSQQIENKMDECQHVLPPGVGVALARPGHPG